MAKLKATAEALSQFSGTLKSNLEDIDNVKKSMDDELQKFLWDDPVGAVFKEKYYEDLKPIKTKLIPALNAYIKYLDNEISFIEQYGAN